jgi:outer membrane protein OmpA-like peptidoglycan-associated protein
MRRLITLLLLVGVASEPASAQGLLGKLKQKTKEKAAQKADQATTAIVDTASGTAEHAVRCVVSDKLCMKNAQAAGQPVVVTNGSGQPVSSKDSAAAIASATAGAPSPPSASGAPSSPASSSPNPTAAAGVTTSAALKPGEGAWANYDFVPGDRTIFDEDFSQDGVGDFPRRLEFKNGNMEVVDWQGGHYLRSAENSAGGSSFAIPLPEVLPERFTVELHYASGGSNYASLKFATESDLNYMVMANGDAGIRGGEVSSVGSGCECTDKFYQLRLMVDGHYAKVYVNETRVANVPNANLGRSNKILVELPWNGTKMLGSIRVAAGGRKLYDALVEKGRVATHGILFDTGSDQIQPESTPTLKEIGQMLTQHLDLKLTIEGYTDNIGEPSANQSLSERRAAAVKLYLVEKAGVDPARLATKGFGASKPAGSNDTPEGRQNNRRVELVKS